MVSILLSASMSNSRFRGSNCSSLNLPSITACICSITRPSAVFILPKSLGMMSTAEPAASSKPTDVARAIITLCSFISESSKPALPFESNPLASSSASASGSKSVGDLKIIASMPIRGMGNLTSVRSFAAISGIGLWPRCGAGPVCTLPNVCSKRAVSVLSGLMSPQRIKPIFEAT